MSPQTLIDPRMLLRECALQVTKALELQGGDRRRVVLNYRSADEICGSISDPPKEADFESLGSAKVSTPCEGRELLLDIEGFSERHIQPLVAHALSELEDKGTPTEGKIVIVSTWREYDIRTDVFSMFLRLDVMEPLLEVVPA